MEYSTALSTAEYWVLVESNCPVCACVYSCVLVCTCVYLGLCPSALVCTCVYLYVLGSLLRCTYVHLCLLVCNWVSAPVHLCALVCTSMYLCLLVCTLISAPVHLCVLVCTWVSAPVHLPLPQIIGGWGIRPNSSGNFSSKSYFIESSSCFLVTIPQIFCHFDIYNCMATVPPSEYENCSPYQILVIPPWVWQLHSHLWWPC